MRVFVSSAPEELAPYQAAAGDVVRELGMELLLRDPGGLAGFRAVGACVHQVAAADVVLAIVGHRRGDAPSPEDGGDGFHPWSWWETRAAFEGGLGVEVLMAADSWRGEPREDCRGEPRGGDANARAVMRDFRGELARLATVFDGDPGDAFRQLVRRRLLARQAAHGKTPASPGAELPLRRWPEPKLPQRPYPVLLPYSHPDLMAGRERELARLRQLLERPVPILGLHAPSGTGKSSLLAAGLVPQLRAEGRPTAFVRHPCEPGIARRLLDDLLEDGADTGVDDRDPLAFVDRLRAFPAPPVLVLDQFEDLLRRADAGPARAAVGMLLAASVQRQVGLVGPPCRWLLAYRQEFHGEVFGWLGDVLRGARLRDARRESFQPTESGPPGTGDLDLPHDLSTSDRFCAWPLSPLGTPPAGSADRAGDAAGIFSAAIEKPLRLTSETGRPLYPWRFAEGGAARLARAFGEARAARRDAPLAPELQVVLAHLLESSCVVGAGGVRVVEVPDDPGELIYRALEEHLRRSLDVAFPAGRKRKAETAAARDAVVRTAAVRIAETATAAVRIAGGRAAGIVDVRTGRTRALLALRELADAHGRRDEGRQATVLARAIGRDGQDVLEKLATPQTRLVLLERRGDAQVYVLSHDRMAEVIVRLVDDEGAYAGLGVDAELLGLRRFVALQRELFTAGEVEQSTRVPEDHFSGIERHADALLWDEEGRRWWRACRGRRRLDRRRKMIRRAVAAAVFVLLTLAVGTWADRYFKRQALLETIAGGEPEAAFAALALLSAESGDNGELLAQVRKREAPFDILERGLGGVGEDRGPAVLRVAELLLPLVAEEPEDPVWIASTVWALDFFVATGVPAAGVGVPAAGDPGADLALQEEALSLRDEVLRPLRQIRPPPPASGDPNWADVPAGTFWMGAGPDDGRDDPNMRDEFPRHQVALSAFRLMTHEVTNAEYRRLFPDHEGAGDLPAAGMTWYQAYTYAAWLGGRLPTESEGEYAARAGCAYAYCRRDGSEATLDEVAWWAGNSVAPETGEPSARPVMQREPNPWGLWDVYGNVWEWNATWYGAYPEALERDPPGPSDSSLAIRTYRGGSAWQPREWTLASGRGADTPELRSRSVGLRVVIAAPSQPPGRI